MKRNYNDWIAKFVKELTSADRIRRPSYETVINQIDVL